ncbi:MAG TPA: 8-amino-7-oxononanoate synthase [Candidatus Deferrimicrobiaceae bacterium]|jgi:8-amino-7-oxononanoate synthase
MDWIEQALEKQERDGLLRGTTAWPATGGRLALGAGRTLLNFSSNDYLDLANDARVKSAASEATLRSGCGATGSRLMSGTLPVHEALEAALARLCGTESALVFGGGFPMNVGILSALAGRDDVIFADRLNHASLVDGARLSGATVKRFPHSDAAALRRMLAKTPVRGRRFVVCESVFSMDGDLAPLAAIGAAAREHGAMWLVDEAHAIGVFGGGGGCCLALDALAPRPDLALGTLGKSLGSFGGFAACSATVRRFLVNRARSFIYATALPPGVAAAALAAVGIVLAEPALGAGLLDRARAFHVLLSDAGLRLPPFSSQILPVHVGDNRRALEFAKRLRDKDLLAVAIRPPTVPAGTARLRLSVTRAHSEEDLAHAAAAIADVARALEIA